MKYNPMLSSVSNEKRISKILRIKKLRMKNHSNLRLYYSKYFLAYIRKVIKYLSLDNLQIRAYSGFSAVIINTIVNFAIFRKLSIFY
jgi:hypothetical protein